MKKNLTTGIAVMALGMFALMATPSHAAGLTHVASTAIRTCHNGHQHGAQHEGQNHIGLAGRARHEGNNRTGNVGRARHEGDIHAGDRHEGDIHAGDRHEGDIHAGDRHEGDIHAGDRRDANHHGVGNIRFRANQHRD